MLLKRVLFFFSIFFTSTLIGQRIVVLEHQLTGYRWGEQSIYNKNIPLCNFEINDDHFSSIHRHPATSISYNQNESALEITLTNTGKDTLIMRNFLPLSIDNNQVYITGKGNHSLSRTHLFIPNSEPINVILPDNLWHLGYNSLKLNDTLSAYFFSRRKEWKNATRRRFDMVIYPGGSVTHQVYTDTFHGDWQMGLKKCFQEKKLYDLQIFDESLYQRTDLQWIKKAKMIHLIMAWDGKLYHKDKKTYSILDFIQKSKSLYGGDDIIGIWPTWPALGLDQRNQWDMYRDMPGGITELKILIAHAHQANTKIFIAYNPWDESTRKEDHLSGMANLINETNADGVILDTRGSSSKELQAAADKIKPGVVMYSEGMAIPADMESIISGRVHNALYYPPILNLNKLIKPDFSIFRVVEVFKEPIRREINSALFNGYGLEFNTFHPGDPMHADEQYRYLGRVLRILREHQENFNSFKWKPLYPSLHKNVLINYWPGPNKEIYSLFKNTPSEISDTIMRIKYNSRKHYVDLWKHQEIESIKSGDESVLKLTFDAYPGEYQNTNNEGTISAIAVFDSLLTCKIKEGESIEYSVSKGTHVLFWPGDPAYDKTPKKFPLGNHLIYLDKLFDHPINKIVIQLFDSSDLIDERIIHWNTDIPIKVMHQEYISSKTMDKHMVLIPADTFRWITTHGDAFIPYPENKETSLEKMNSFYFDKNLVTNKDFQNFLIKSKYKPIHNTNFLKHWVKTKIPKGLENHPVVFISKTDAAAYCKWNKKRLPTELEWQYAAQTSKRNFWPWGNEAGIKNVKSEIITETLTHEVYESFDSTKANPGNSKLDPINFYPGGKNEFGISDLVGSVWQITADDYKVGSYRYTILKGGSYYKPSSSWWYVQGGPKPLPYRQMWLQVDDGFERNATVGCRCMRDK